MSGTKTYKPSAETYFANLPSGDILSELDRKVLDYGDYCLRMQIAKFYL